MGETFYLAAPIAHVPLIPAENTRNEFNEFIEQNE